jgi:hypothetical protein
MFMQTRGQATSPPGQGPRDGPVEDHCGHGDHGDHDELDGIDGQEHGPTLSPEEPVVEQGATSLMALS